MARVHISQPSASDRFTLTFFVEGGRMPLTCFIRTTDDLQKLLRAIEEAQLGEASHAQWEIDSDRIQIAASVNGVSADDLESIINDAYQSLKATDAQDEAGIPSTVNDRAKRLTRSIVNRARRTTPIVIEAPGQEPIYIEPEPLVGCAADRVVPVGFGVEPFPSIGRWIKLREGRSRTVEVM